MPLDQDFKQARKRGRKNAPKGSLMRDLYETNQDIKRHLNGVAGEASLEEMLKAKQRMKKEMREEVKKEEEAEKRDSNPRQLSPIHLKPKIGWA
jgi:hypothetical protein